MNKEGDLELLRKHEPLVVYTQGENFFPTDVDNYLAECSLWVDRADAPPEKLLTEGGIKLRDLAKLPAAGFDTVYYLRFVESLNPRQLLRYRRSHIRYFKQSRGRLARVGLLSRLLDTVFSITLLLRGTVPGGTAAAAHEIYTKLADNKKTYSYYGRVVRQSGYIALQYWFFYCMNDWRTGFHGVNDHEADWEQIVVYLSETDNGKLEPRWVAYAAHEFEGDDLRRRWDDPLLEKSTDGQSPVVYAGAGSHASYFMAGEYLHEVIVPFTGVLDRLWKPVDRFWRQTLRQGGVLDKLSDTDDVGALLHVPFVDYARGDGLRIGPGEEHSWDAVLIPHSSGRSFESPFTWAEEYRGLWGLHARDPIAGENAPAGPKFNRDGSVRHAWYDPVGWAGLNKVPPEGELLPVIQSRIEATEEHMQDTEEAITRKKLLMRGLWTESQAMEGASHFLIEYRSHMERIDELQEEISNHYLQITQDRALIESLLDMQARSQHGEQAAVEAHIKRAHLPVTEEGAQLGRLAETWAALSMGVLILGTIAVAIFAPQFWFMGFLTVVGVTAFLEAFFRREARYLVQRVVVGLSVISAIVLISQFFFPLMILLIVGLGVFVIVDNLSELRGT